MHDAVQTWIEKIKDTYPSYFAACSVLEIGSRNVNGSAREYFSNCEYIGIDLSEGKGVDVVCSASDHMRQGKQYSVIVCTETLEHDKDFRLTCAAMYHMLAPYGLLIITAAGPMRKEHGTHLHTPEDSPATLDHYQNISQPMLLEALGIKDFIIHECVYSPDETDIHFYGIKR